MSTYSSIFIDKLLVFCYNITMRSFHEHEGFTSPQAKLSLPDNVVLLATHGSRLVPSHFNLSQELLHPVHGESRLKDFSDFGTGMIQEYFLPGSIVTPPRYGRIGGDANREATINRDFENEEQNQAFRATTMSGLMPLWSSEFRPSEYDQLLLLDENHSPYFDKITATALEKLATTDAPLLFVDLHDTGDVRLMPDGTAVEVPKRVERYGHSRFWEAVISDKDGTSADPAVTQIFVQAVKQAYEEHAIANSDSDVLVNEYYKGGYVTRFIGQILPKKLMSLGVDPSDANRIHAIQLEIPRRRYITDELHQTVDVDAIKNEAHVQQRLLSLAGTAIFHYRASRELK